MYVPRYDGFRVDMVNEAIDEELDGVAADVHNPDEGSPGYFITWIYQLILWT